MDRATLWSTEMSFSRKRLGGGREAGTCWSAARSGPARRCNDGLTPVVFKLERVEDDA
jgi:uncharacterized repeat protein (TIGR04076 family)